MRRWAEVATLISALTGLAGLLLGFFGLPVVVNSPTARIGTEKPQPTVTVTVTATPQAAETPAPAGTGPALPSGSKSVSKAGIRMPSDYHVLLSDDPIELHKGYSGDLGFMSDVGRGIETARGGTLVLLDRGQQGSLEACKAETRFTDTILPQRLINGSQICVQRNGHVGLMTIREVPQERDGNTFITFDLTVWP
ncbi:hypothetical protein ACFCZ1_21885 [Streptomyces sp. NPDC056224]|uniref:hypothetical protein n=1 Tax=Streptomyces sp. NPDC056224 TaxID=3345750 RepID=UPI0035D5BDD8